MMATYYHSFFLAIVAFSASWMTIKTADAFLLPANRLASEKCGVCTRHLLLRRDQDEISSITALRIGTGFSFDDGEQVLVSVQKPLGILLEQDEEEEGAPVVVAEVDPTGSAGQAGVQPGDVLVAVHNASVETQSLEYAMNFLGQAPRVVNLRFIRR